MRRTGRPTAVDSQRRLAHLVRLVAAGTPWRAAAFEARVKPDTVLGLLDDPQFAAVAARIISERAGLQVAA